MSNFLLKELKKEGHNLLNEYISLDPIKSKRKVTVSRAYSKLNYHFSHLNTTAELLRAIQKLKSMIKYRKQKFEDKKKEQFAPNLKELQRRDTHKN